MLVAVYHRIMLRKTWSHDAPSTSWGSPGETLEYTWYMLLIPQWYQNYDKLIKLAHGYQACNHTYPTPIIISTMGRVVWGYILGTHLALVWWEPGMNKYCMKYIFLNNTSMLSWFNLHINRIFVNKGLQQMSVEFSLL